MSTEPNKPLNEVAGGNVPGATYRVQFSQGFTFAQARDLAGYLRELGVSDLYASPLFQAGPQSTHGYDTCNFEQFSSDLGTRNDFDQFSAELRRLGLGLLLDVVPNHMGADPSNPWWADVLQHGRASGYSSFFDIDWRPAKSDLHDQVLLPVLENHYSAVLESGKLQLVRGPDGFAIAYYKSRFPISPEVEAALLEEVAGVLAKDPENQALSRDVAQHSSEFRIRIIAAAGPPAGLGDRIGRWSSATPEFGKAMEQVCQDYQGDPGQPHSFDRLHRLLAQQHYRLASWRVGPEEINYRRFFDVAQLVSLRMEQPAVFDASHRLVRELLRNGQVTGLRVDHPDGLWDPKQYFVRLQASFRQLYVVAEKILSPGEHLRRDWPVAGTTGYDFLNQVNGLFVDRANAARFDALYRRFSGNGLTFAETVYLGKRRILEESLISELRSLTHRLKRLALASRSGQDFTINQLHAALEEIIARFPVYRSYIDEQSQIVIPVERAWIEEAVAKAKSSRPDLDGVILDFIQDLLLLREPIDFDDEAKRLSREFVLRFQQLTGPVMAKGLEDTAFYNYNRLVSLNDVGGDPGQFGLSVEDFHRHNLFHAEQWPHSLLATATHDTKRGEDVRARLNVLSELPGEWESALERWTRANQAKKKFVAGELAPDPNDEFLLYQTLVGAWPFQAPETEVIDYDLASFKHRISTYMRKAVRESKAHTSWTRPDTLFEEALEQFIAQVLDPVASRSFLDDLIPFQRRIASFGMWNSLAQLVLKLTAPGVPDIYQGTELWDLSLVDPDNRRPVDYEERQRLLRDLIKQSAHSTRADLVARLLSQSHTGQIKLYLLWRALDLRRRRPALFQDGRYLPLNVSGAKSAHVCAFARVHEGDVTLTVVPRLVVGLLEGKVQAPLGTALWRDTILDLSAGDLDGLYRNVLTGEVIELNRPNAALSQILKIFPLALLERTSPGRPL